MAAKTARVVYRPTRACCNKMSQSWEKFVLIISLLLIAAAASHTSCANRHSTEDTTSTNGIAGQYAENIKGTIQKHMQLINDDLFAVRRQLQLQHERVDKFRCLQLQERMSKMTQALRNCDIQVRGVRRQDTAKLLCGQLTVLLWID
jgi:hypothetical protein